MKEPRPFQLRRCLCFLAMALVPLLAQSASPAPPAPFLMGTGADGDTYVGKWIRMVHQEAFKRMQLPLAFTVAPLKRITTMSERGAIDGEPARAPAYGATHPDMVMVDFALMEVVFGIYTAKPLPGMRRIEDLRDSHLIGTYARGVIGCENALTPVFPANQLSAVSTAENGLAMLARGHTDFYCDVSSNMLNILASATGRAGLQPHKLFDLGSKVPLRAYVQKKHAALAPLFAATLKQMKAEGLFERYWLEADKQMQKQIQAP